jgi:hypothetical protein
MSMGAIHLSTSCCLALFHSDFTHKNAIECNRNYWRPWEPMSYFPLHQEECLRQKSNYGVQKDYFGHLC